MYNGIGLQTPRGSGTSGHITKNMGLSIYKRQSKDQFLKQLEEKRNNNLPPPRKANSQIINHQRNREVYIHLLKLRQQLQKQGIKKQQIEEKIKKAEKIIRQKIQKGEIKTNTKDTHVMTQAKEKQYMKLSKAFGLSNNIKSGSAFNFEAERQAKWKRMQEKRLKPKFQCPHENCQKIYDLKQRLDRHLKYKHKKQIQKIQN